MRQVNKPKLFRLTDSLKRDARLWLRKEKLSPELIAARWRKLGVDGVSHETLYTWIWEAKKSKHRILVSDNMLYLALRHGRRRRKRGNYHSTRGAIKNTVPISERPECVNLHQRIGDVEVDLMMGSKRKNLLYETLHFSR
ncbi:MAG: hypothetical protein COA49_03375 [Bacteroidetes bacterium]|nr:MAG: hypothetical protein COA49_03375 [Bacteroidota bacterium]